MYMDREIFNLNLSVEATSLYIMLCTFMDQGTAPTLQKAKMQWAGSGESLTAAVEELICRGVLNSPLPVADDLHLHPAPRNMWNRCC
jgi:hypothetical protein